MTILSQTRGAECDRSRAKLSLGPVLDEELIGRIEEWVVSTLDARGTRANEPGWQDSVDTVSLARRSSKKQITASHELPSNPGGWARFRLSKRRGITIVSLTDQALVKEEDVEELIGDLLALIEAGHRRILIDFFGVQRLSSWAANTINETVRRSVSADDAVFKFSGVCPDVATMFAITGLESRVTLAPDTSSAVAGQWPESPEFAPLPVSILAALMTAEATRNRAQADTRQRLGPNYHHSPFPLGRFVQDQPTMSVARLIIQDGPSMGRPVSINRSRFVIGRGPDCQLRLGSASVSRSHASIERRGARLMLRDLQSTNGTRLNGQILQGQEIELRDGDRIQVGPLTFSLSIHPETDRFGRVPVEVDLDPSEAENFGLTQEFEDPEHVGANSCLKSEIIQGVLVITPLVTDLDAEAVVDAFRDSLIVLLGRKLPKRVVVNLTHVSHLSGRAIGVLVAHHLRLDRSGGSMRICLANPRVALVLEQVKLAMLVDYHQNVDDAVIASWPEPAEVGHRS